MQKVQGWVENGNITVSIANTGYVSSTKVQGSFPLGTVTVYLAGTLTLASIYSDDLSTPTVKANPFVAANSGQWFFYAPNGAYDVKFSGGGIAAPFTLGDIRLFDEASLWVDVKSSPYFAKGNGSTNDRAAIAAADTAAQLTGASLLFPPGSFKISSNLTITSPCTFVPGASLLIDPGVTVIFNGVLTAARQSLFTNTGTVSFGKGSVSSIPAEWFGAVGDWDGATGTDNTAAIQKAANAILGSAIAGEVRSTNTNISPITFGPRSYMWIGTLDFPDFQYLQFEGAGPSVSFLVHNPSGATTDGMKFRSTSATYCYSNAIRHLSLISVTTNTRRLIVLNFQAQWESTDCVYGSSPVSKPTNLLYMDGMIGSLFDHCQFNFALSDNVVFHNANTSTTVGFRDCRFEQAGRANLVVGGGESIWLDRCILESAVSYGVELYNNSGVFLNNCHLEANGIHAFYNDGTGGANRLKIINSKLIGTDTVTHVLINIDEVTLQIGNSEIVTYKTAFQTTANTLIQILSDALSKSFSYIFNTGAGVFSTSGAPMPILAYSDFGNLTGTQNVAIHRGGLIKFTLTGNATINLTTASQAYPAGTKLLLYFVQGGAGAFTITFGAGGGNNFAVLSALSTVNNVTGSVCMIELTYDGTQFVQTNYTGWFSATTGFPLQSSSATTRTLTDLSVTNQLTTGGALDANFGISYKGAPTLFDFVSGSAIDWVSEASVPNRAGSGGQGFGHYNKLTAASGTQTKGVGYCSNAVGGAFTNMTHVLLGTRVSAAGNWGIYDASGYAWYQDAGGLLIGPATGGALGTGKINVSGDIYNNNTKYNNPDYALEHFFTGHIRRFKSNPGATSYRGLKTLKAVRQYAQKFHRLPGFSKAKGAFARFDILLEKVEEIFCYLWRLDERIRALEKK